MGVGFAGTGHRDMVSVIESQLTDVKKNGGDRPKWRVGVGEAKVWDQCMGQVSAAHSGNAALPSRPSRAGRALATSSVPV